MTTIEETVLAIITADNGNWAAGPTKTEHIKGKSDTKALNLENPVVGVDETVIVVEKFSKSLRHELGGANVYLYEGDLSLHSNNEADADTSQGRLKTLFDANYGYKFIKQGIVRVQYKNRFLSEDRLEIEVLETDG